MAPSPMGRPEYSLSQVMRARSGPCLLLALLDQVARGAARGADLDDAPAALRIEPLGLDMVVDALDLGPRARLAD